jgi:hypothetical protein
VALIPAGSKQTEENHMDKLTVIIRRNASYEKGMYGLSIHDQPGGAGNVEPINSETHLREKLLGFGLTKDHANDVIATLENKGESVKLNVLPPRIFAREKTSIGASFSCDRCSWRISMELEDNAKARQLFTEHACPDFPVAANP